MDEGSELSPPLLRLTGVLHSYEVWLVTSHETRDNPRVAATKDALAEMLRAAGDEISGGA
jgi:hypothetical protein